MQNKKEVFDYEALKKRDLEQFRSGKDLFSKGGAFAPLEQDNPELNNRKKGYNTKLLKTYEKRKHIRFNNKDSLSTFR